jgi:HD-like signal output (HDOD) protein
VAYLGLDTLTTLALGHGLFQSDSSKGSEALWRHSLETAMAARAIALCEHLPPARLDEAFLTGMLHDVGRVVFAAAGGADHAKDPDIAATVDGLHAEAGAYLLGLWGFPSQIVAAVALHHHPGQGAAPGLDLTLVVHVADRLVRHPDTSAQTPEQLGIEPGLLEQLGMADRLPAWRAAVNSAASEKEAS